MGSGPFKFARTWAAAYVHTSLFLTALAIAERLS